MLVKDLLPASRIVAACCVDWLPAPAAAFPQIAVCFGTHIDVYSPRCDCDVLAWTLLERVHCAAPVVAMASARGKLLLLDDCRWLSVVRRAAADAAAVDPSTGTLHDVDVDDTNPAATVPPALVDVLAAHDLSVYEPRSVLTVSTTASYPDAPRLIVDAAGTTAVAFTGDRSAQIHCFRLSAAADAAFDETAAIGFADYAVPAGFVHAPAGDTVLLAVTLYTGSAGRYVPQRLLVRPLFTPRTEDTVVSRIEAQHAGNHPIAVCRGKTEGKAVVFCGNTRVATTTSNATGRYERPQNPARLATVDLREEVVHVADIASRPGYALVVTDHRLYRHNTRDVDDCEAWECLGLVPNAVAGDAFAAHVEHTSRGAGFVAFTTPTTCVVVDPNTGKEVFAKRYFGRATSLAVEQETGAVHQGSAHGELRTARVAVQLDDVARLDDLGAAVSCVGSLRSGDVSVALFSIFDATRVLDMAREDAVGEAADTGGVRLDERTVHAAALDDGLAVQVTPRHVVLLSLTGGLAERAVWTAPDGATITHAASHGRTVAAVRGRSIICLAVNDAGTEWTPQRELVCDCDVSALGVASGCVMWSTWPEQRGFFSAPVVEPPALSNADGDSSSPPTPPPDRMLVEVAHGAPAQFLVLSTGQLVVATRTGAVCFRSSSSSSSEWVKACAATGTACIAELPKGDEKRRTVDVAVSWAATTSLLTLARDGGEGFELRTCAWGERGPSLLGGGCLGGAPVLLYGQGQAFAIAAVPKALTNTVDVRTVRVGAHKDIVRAVVVASRVNRVVAVVQPAGATAVAELRMLHSDTMSVDTMTSCPLPSVTRPNSTEPEPTQVFDAAYSPRTETIVVAGTRGGGSNVGGFLIIFSVSPALAVLRTVTVDRPVVSLAVPDTGMVYAACDKGVVAFAPSAAEGLVAVARTSMFGVAHVALGARGSVCVGTLDGFFVVRLEQVRRNEYALNVVSMDPAPYAALLTGMVAKPSQPSDNCTRFLRVDAHRNLAIVEARVPPLGAPPEEPLVEEEPKKSPPRTATARPLASQPKECTSLFQHRPTSLACCFRLTSQPVAVARGVVGALRVAGLTHDCNFIVLSPHEPPSPPFMIDDATPTPDVTLLEATSVAACDDGRVCVFMLLPQRLSQVVASLEREVDAEVRGSEPAGGGVRRGALLCGAPNTEVYRAKAAVRASRGLGATEMRLFRPLLDDAPVPVLERVHERMLADYPSIVLRDVLRSLECMW